MMADAYAFRAICHFDLVRVFAQQYNYTTDASHPGIVLKIKNVAVTTPTPAVSTVKEVYKQILSDIDSALARYTNSVEIYTTGTAKTYFSTDAVTALRARVCLYMQDWDGVIAACNTLINAAKYPLLSNAQYVASWSGKTISSESIFELAYGTRTGGSLGDYYNPNLTLTGQYAATSDLLNLFATGDVRGKPSMFKDVTISGTTYSFPSKYWGTADSANNIKLFRATELYLSRAEAYAQKIN